VGIVIAVLLGLGVGEILRRRLNRLAYRLAPEGGDDEAGLPASELTHLPAGGDDVDESALPLPGARWWIPAVLACAWGCATWLVWLSGADWFDQSIRLVGWLGFSTIGVWLSAVDLDVRRLPDVGQMWLAGICVVFGVLIMWDTPIRLLIGLCAGLGCGLAFLLIHLLSRGGLGLGDVKLIMICGWWLGLTSLSSVFSAMVLACVLAIAYSLISRTRLFAFGPWLLAGTMIAGLVVVH